MQRPRPGHGRLLRQLGGHLVPSVEIDSSHTLPRCTCDAPVMHLCLQFMPEVSGRWLGDAGVPEAHSADLLQRFSLRLPYYIFKYDRSRCGMTYSATICA